MPDPFVIAQAMAAAALTAAAILLGGAGWRRPIAARRMAVGWPLAIGSAFLVGAAALGQRPDRLPGTDKDRLLLLVIPLVTVVESILAAAQPMAIWRWVARLALAASIAPILLHGSVYLASPASAGSDTWTASQRVMHLGGIAVLLATQWRLVVGVQERGRAGAAWVALAVTSLGAGIVTMLSGYMSAGQLALPLAAACGAAAVLGGVTRMHDAAGGIVVALACLGSVLVMGRFFGALSTTKALVFVTAPLLCWLLEIRRHTPGGAVTKSDRRAAS